MKILEENKKRPPQLINDNKMTVKYSKILAEQTKKWWGIDKVYTTAVRK
jgi:hypothetical protein